MNFAVIFSQVLDVLLKEQKGENLDLLAGKVGNMC